MLLMIREGETSFVELKRRIPTEGIGPSVAAFANTLGGWLILGVDDKSREVVGWKPKGRADPVDFLREGLRAEVDPLPPFAAKQIELEQGPVGVVRIYESADTPHVLRKTGAVYVREPGRKRPVDSHAELIELARRGEEAERRARQRLVELPVVGHVMPAPDSGQGWEERSAIRWIVRAAPLTISPVTRDWPLTEQAATWCLQHLEGMLARRPPYGRSGPAIEPYGRAIVARLTQEASSEIANQATLVADSGGVFAAELAFGTAPGELASVLVQGMLEDRLKPLARTTATFLEEAEAIGRAAVDLWCLQPSEGASAGQASNSLRLHLHSARELPVPASADEVDDLAESWHRELQRTLGIVRYEP